MSEFTRIIRGLDHAPLLTKVMIYAELEKQKKLGRVAYADMVEKNRESNDKLKAYSNAIKVLRDLKPTGNPDLPDMTLDEGAPKWADYEGNTVPPQLMGATRGPAGFKLHKNERKSSG